jgi:GNAT superfamily N-acetyltransferase
MSIASSISRFADYYGRHGFSATIRRACLAVNRMLFANRMIVFYCDLAGQSSRAVAIPSSLRIDRITSEVELSPEILQEITGFWNPKQARRNVEERFGKGASLWLISSGERSAGYGWTLRGGAIAPYYFPMTPNDVQLFDFYVFPKFRGRALHWLLTGHILQTLAAEGAARAFADTHEWNQAQLSSFKMTRFRQLGVVRTYDILGYKFVNWIHPRNGNPLREDRKDGQKSHVLVGSHER